MSTIREKLDEIFEQLACLCFRHRLKTLIIITSFTALLISQLPNIQVDTSIEGFLHYNDPARTAYRTFKKQFGRDELIIVTIRPPEIYDQGFLKKLKAFHDEVEISVPFLDDITSLVNARNTRGEGDRLIVEDLLEHWPDTPGALAALKQRVMDNENYRNLLVDATGKITTVVIQLESYTASENESELLTHFEENTSDDPAAVHEKKDRNQLTDEQNSAAVTTVVEIMKRYESPDFKMDIAGSSVVSHYLKELMLQDMRKFLALIILAVAVFLFVMFRRISGVILPLLTVCLSLLSSMGLMSVLGTAIKLPTQVLPSFLLAIGVGYSVHILAIFFYRMQHGSGKADAVAFAFRHASLAIVMTAITTATGLFSFANSDVAPISDLGIFAGLGVVMALIYTLTLLPAMLAFIPVKASVRSVQVEKKILLDWVLNKFGLLATRKPLAILVATSLIIAFSVMGITRIRFSHDVLRWLPETNPARLATELIDKDLRGTINLEVVVDTEKQNGLYEPDVMNRLEESREYVEKIHYREIYVGKAWSITTILKEIHKALNENRQEFYKIPQDRELIAQELLLFENSGSDELEDFTDSQFSKARFTIKVPFVDTIQYSGFIDMVARHFHERYQDARVTFTGIMTLYSRTIYNGIASMAESYLLALIIISILMIALIGRFYIGVLSMIPNLTPILLTLGIMGWLDIPMNLFTMLVGSIAIGLAVDDTIHFMHNYHRYLENGNDARESVMLTLNTTGRALLVTSAVLTTGFVIFMFANMHNLIYFGFLTAFTIIMALLSDFLIAPALMVLVHRKVRLGDKKTDMGLSLNEVPPND